MNREKIKKLPDAPGVYLFYNSADEIIYVGKATSLRNRVRGYFSGLKSPRPIEFMIHEVEKINYEETGSALEAVILEGKYIKQFMPKYNVLGRDDKSWNYLCVTKDDFPRLEPAREHELKTSEKKYAKIFGPFPGLNTKEALRILRKLFYISTCQPPTKPKGIIRSAQNDKREKPCFYYQIGQCLGVCTGEISAKEYAQKVIRPLVLFLSGNKKKLITNLEKEMAEAAREENFEEAGRLRNQIGALQRIQDVALLNKSFVNDGLVSNCHPRVGGDPAVERLDSRFRGNDKPFRIEGYDISNLGASGKVGSMVVFDESGPVKSAYRKFKIKTVVGQSDVDCLAEVLERRLKHSEWPLPNVFLVDGGLPQVNKAKKILRKNDIFTPIIGIAKGPTRKKNEFFVVADKNTDFSRWFSQNTALLIRVRDEAHRFAIAFQRQQRKIA